MRIRLLGKITYPPAFRILFLIREIRNYRIFENKINLVQVRISIWNTIKFLNNVHHQYVWYRPWRFIRIVSKRCTVFSSRTQQIPDLSWKTDCFTWAYWWVNFKANRFYTLNGRKITHGKIILLYKLELLMDRIPRRSY